MATKKRSFEPDSCYHIYNCGVEKRKTFNDDRDYSRFLKTIEYYLYSQIIPYSQFNKLVEESQKAYLKTNPPGSRTKCVAIFSYCLMPNHFHFLIKQLNTSGIKDFLSDITNSYTKYFNTKYDRFGYLFQGNFKAKEITDVNSFLQVSRYIHLNPIKSTKTNWQKELESYPYSSYKNWIRPEDSSIIKLKERETLLELRPKEYQKFVNSKAIRNSFASIEDLILEDNHLN